MAEEHNLYSSFPRGTYLDEHKFTWASGLRNISYVPQCHVAEEHKSLCSSGNQET
jgi:hypothetical protein